MNIDKIISAIKDKNSIVACDTETVSLIDKSLVAFSVCIDGESYAFFTGMKYIKNISKEDQDKLINAILSTSGVIYHNYAYDGLVWAYNGYGKQIEPHDTLLISHLCNEVESHKLKDLVLKYCNYQMIKFKEVCGTGKKQISFSEVTDEVQAHRYSSDDALYTYKLYKVLIKKLNESTLRCYEDIERPLLNVILDMHVAGVPINKAKIDKIRLTCTDKVADYEQQMKYYLGKTNINSPKQLRKYFIEKKHMPVIKQTKTGAISMDTEVLEEYQKLGSIEAKLILGYRKYNKMLTTFVPALTPGEDGKIYPGYRQNGTTSGRLSCAKPAFQTIPKDDEFNIRDCIEAIPGYTLVGADFSQMELRLAAHYSQDTNLMSVYEQGLDIHKTTMDAVGCSRRQAKCVNFSILYGIGVRALAENLETNIQEAKLYMYKYHQNYPGLARMVHSTTKQLLKDGYITLHGGRQRHISENFPYKTDWERKAELRSISNALIQGAGANIMKEAMIIMSKKLATLDAYLIATIHDEVIVMCRDNIVEQVKKIVEDSMLEPTKVFSVPFLVNVQSGQTWANIH